MPSSAFAYRRASRSYMGAKTARSQSREPRQNCWGSGFAYGHLGAPGKCQDNCLRECETDRQMTIVTIR